MPLTLMTVPFSASSPSISAPSSRSEMAPASLRDDVTASAHDSAPGHEVTSRAV